MVQALTEVHVPNASYVGCVCLYVHGKKRHHKTVTNAHEDKGLRGGHKTICSMILKNKSEREHPEEKINLWSKQSGLTMAREKRFYKHHL